MKPSAIKSFARKLIHLLVTFSYLHLNLSPCFATGQNLEDEVTSRNLLHHNSFSNQLIFVDRGTFLPGEDVKESDLPLTGALSVSVIPLTNQSLFRNAHLIPHDPRRFLAELGLSNTSWDADVLKRGLHLRITQVRYADSEGVSRPVFYEDIFINQQTGHYARLKNKNRQKLHLQKEGSDLCINFHNRDVRFKGRLSLNGGVIVEQLNSSTYGINLQTFATLLFKPSFSSAPLLNLSSLNIRNQAKLSCQALFFSAIGDEHEGFIVNEPSGQLNIEHKVDLLKGQLYNYGKLSFVHGGVIDLHGNNLLNLPAGWNPLTLVTAQRSGVYTGGPLMINQGNYILNRAALDVSGPFASMSFHSKVIENEALLPRSPALFVNAERFLDFESNINQRPGLAASKITVHIPPQGIVQDSLSSASYIYNIFCQRGAFQHLLFESTFDHSAHSSDFKAALIERLGLFRFYKDGSFDFEGIQGQNAQLIDLKVIAPKKFTLSNIRLNHLNATAQQVAFSQRISINKGTLKSSTSTPMYPFFKVQENAVLNIRSLSIGVTSRINSDNAAFHNQGSIKIDKLFLNHCSSFNEREISLKDLHFLNFYHHVKFHNASGSSLKITGNMKGLRPDSIINEGDIETSGLLSWNGLSQLSANQGSWVHTGDIDPGAKNPKMITKGQVTFKDGAFLISHSDPLSLNNYGSLTLTNFKLRPITRALDLKAFKLNLTNHHYLHLGLGTRLPLALDNHNKASLKPQLYSFKQLRNDGTMTLLSNAGIQSGWTFQQQGDTLFLMPRTLPTTNLSNPSLESGTLFHNQGTIEVPGSLTFALPSALGRLIVPGDLDCTATIEGYSRSLYDLEGVYCDGTTRATIEGGEITREIDLTGLYSLRLNTVSSLKPVAQIDTQELFLQSQKGFELGQDNNHFGAVYARRGQLSIETQDPLKAQYGRLYSRGPMHLSANNNVVQLGEFITKSGIQRGLGCAWDYTDVVGDRFAYTNYYDVNGSLIYSDDILTINGKQVQGRGAQLFSQGLMTLNGQQLNLIRSILSGRSSCAFNAPGIAFKIAGYQLLHLGWMSSHYQSVSHYAHLSTGCDLNFAEDILFRGNDIVAEASRLLAGREIYDQGKIYDTKTSSIKVLDAKACNHNIIKSVIQAGQRIILKVDEGVFASLNLNTQKLDFNFKSLYATNHYFSRHDTPEVTVEVSLNDYFAGRAAAGIGPYRQLEEGTVEAIIPVVAGPPRLGTLPTIGGRIPEFVLDPLAGIDLALPLQDLMSHYAGQVHHQSRSGRDLYDHILNASAQIAQQEEREGQLVSLEERIQNSTDILIYHVLKEMQKGTQTQTYLDTIAHFPREAINRYQAPGDWSANTMRFVTTKGDMVFESQRHVAGTSYGRESTQGSIKERTIFTTFVDSGKRGESIVQRAHPQAQVIVKNGNFEQTAAKNIESTGVSRSINGNVTEEAGEKIVDRSLVLTDSHTERKKGHRGISRKSKAEETTTQKVIPNSSHVTGSHLKKAPVIDMQGTSTHAGQGLTLDGHVTGDALVGKSTHSTTKKSFSAVRRSASNTTNQGASFILPNILSSDTFIRFMNGDVVLKGTHLRAPVIIDESYSFSLGPTLYQTLMQRSIKRGSVIGASWYERDAGRDNIVPSIVQAEQFLSYRHRDPEVTNLLHLCSVFMEVGHYYFGKDLQEEMVTLREWDNIKGGRVGFSMPCLEKGDSFVQAMQGLGRGEGWMDQGASYISAASEATSLFLDGAKLYAAAQAGDPAQMLATVLGRYASISLSVSKYESRYNRTTTVPNIIQARLGHIENQTTVLAGHHMAREALRIVTERLEGIPLYDVTRASARSRSGGLSYNLITGALSASFSRSATNHDHNIVLPSTVIAGALELDIGELSGPLKMHGRRVSGQVRSNTRLETPLSSESSTADSVSATTSGNMRFANKDYERAYIADRAGLTADHYFDMHFQGDVHTLSAPIGLTPAGKAKLKAAQMMAHIDQEIAAAPLQAMQATTTSASTAGQEGAEEDTVEVSAAYQAARAIGDRFAYRTLTADYQEAQPLTSQGLYASYTAYPTLGDGDCFFHAALTEPGDTAASLTARATGIRHALPELVQRTPQYQQMLRPELLAVARDAFLAGAACPPEVPLSLWEKLRQNSDHEMMREAARDRLLWELISREAYNALSPAEQDQRQEEALRRLPAHLQADVKHSDADLLATIDVEALINYARTYEDASRYIEIAPGQSTRGCMADIIAHHCGLRINCFLFDRRETLSYNGFVGEENHRRVVNVLLANASSDPTLSPNHYWSLLNPQETLLRHHGVQQAAENLWQSYGIVPAPSLEATPQTAAAEQDAPYEKIQIDGTRTHEELDTFEHKSGFVVNLPIGDIRSLANNLEQINKILQPRPHTLSPRSERNAKNRHGLWSVLQDNNPEEATNLDSIYKALLARGFNEKDIQRVISSGPLHHTLLRLCASIEEIQAVRIDSKLNGHEEASGNLVGTINLAIRPPLTQKIYHRLLQATESLVDYCDEHPHLASIATEALSLACGGPTKYLFREVLDHTCGEVIEAGEAKLIETIAQKLNRPVEEVNITKAFVAFGAGILLEKGKKIVAKAKEVKKQVKTYQAYIKINRNTGEAYVGRTSGINAPLVNIAKRDNNHHMNSKGFGPAKLSATSSNKDAIRGQEQLMIEKLGGAKSKGGNSGNTINSISDRNPKKDHYLTEAKKEFKSDG